MSLAELGIFLNRLLKLDRGIVKLAAREELVTAIDVRLRIGPATAAAKQNNGDR
jgi:hypothetical protein